MAVVDKLSDLFEIGNSQAVKLPEEFKIAGDKVRIRSLGQGLFLEPIGVHEARPDVVDWYARMDAIGPFEIDREQELTAD